MIQQFRLAYIKVGLHIIRTSAVGMAISFGQYRAKLRKARCDAKYN